MTIQGFFLFAFAVIFAVFLIWIILKNRYPDSKESTPDLEVKPSGKDTKSEPETDNPWARDEVTVIGGVRLVGLDFELAEHLKGRTDNVLELDDEAVLRDSGSIAVWAAFTDYTGNNVEKLGRLPNEVTKEIRKADIAQELGVEIDEIWAGDEGGAIVLISLVGKKEHLIRLLEYQVNSRPERKTNKAGYLRGHPTRMYTHDLRLFTIREDWAAHENLLKELIEADCQSPDHISDHYVLELARFYRKNKRYEDEKQLITDFEILLQSKGQHIRDTLASRLRRSTQLATKASTKK